MHPPYCYYQPYTIKKYLTFLTNLIKIHRMVFALKAHGMLDEHSCVFSFIL